MEDHRFQREGDSQNTVVDLPGGLSIELLYIAPGEFLMGSPESEEGRREDESQHLVRLTQGYWLGKTQVTQGQWKALMGNNPSRFIESGLDAPVECVSWQDATDFCRKLSKQDQVAGCMPEGYEYGMPTEAQWEYACRAGTMTEYHRGETESDLWRVGWYDANSHMTTHPVARKKPNPWGLYDMHGNVWEWCQDSYEESPGESPASALDVMVNPVGLLHGPDRVVRGGSWLDSAISCRAASICSFGVDDRYGTVGFRLALRSAIR